MIWPHPITGHKALHYEIASEPQLALFLLELHVACTRQGFAREEAGRIATAASELARNILKYACKGKMSYRFFTRRGKVGVDITAVDNGPGIPDLELAVTDHYSTSGTLGLGLPGVKRLADEFQIESVVGKGTSVRFQIVASQPVASAAL